MTPAELLDLLRSLAPLLGAGGIGWVGTLVVQRYQAANARHSASVSADAQRHAASEQAATQREKNELDHEVTMTERLWKRIERLEDQVGVLQMAVNRCEETRLLDARRAIVHRQALREEINRLRERLGEEPLPPEDELLELPPATPRPAVTSTSDSAPEPRTSEIMPEIAAAVPPQPRLGGALH